MEVLNYGEMGSSISNYIYDSGKLIEIDIKQKEHNKNEIAKYKVYFESVSYTHLTLPTSDLV